MNKFFLIICIFSLGCAKTTPAEWEDVTHNYKLPSELEGSKIFVLGGGWSSTNPLWVIVPPKGSNQPIIIEQNQ